MATETIRYSPLGLQDLRIGTGKFEVTLADGRTVIMDEVGFGYMLSDAYARAALPPTGIPGRVARVTDDIGGLWMEEGNQWGSLTGMLVAKPGDNLTTLMNRLPALGGCILIPGGTTIDISEKVTFPTAPNKRVQVRGCGWGSAVQWTGGNADALFGLPSITGATVTGHSVSHLRLLKSASQTGLVGIDVGTKDGPYSITELSFTEVHTNGLDIGIRFNAEANEVRITNCWFFDIVVAGIQGRRTAVGSGASCSNFTLIGNHFQGLTVAGSAGVDINGGSRYTLIGNTFQGGNGGAVDMTGILLDRWDAVTLIGNYMELLSVGAGMIGIDLQATSPEGGAIIEGNHIQTGGGIKIRLRDGTAIFVMSNWLEGAGTGIQIDAACDQAFIGPQLYRSGLTSKLVNNGSQTVRMDPDSTIGIVLPTTGLTPVQSALVGTGGATDRACFEGSAEWQTSGGLPRLNYLKCRQPTVTGAAVIDDACLAYFDAAIGTHKAVDGATTKTTPSAVNAWIKVNMDGTILYMPAYTSKTS